MPKISPKIDNVFLHGADYNPDQWLKYPAILEKDVELMKKANVNVVSLGIFAWATLEPKEGEYNFAWMDEIIDRLWANGIYVDLATPSAAKPSWMARDYPEVLRVNKNYDREQFGDRHNHCFTSPKYRELITKMNKALAVRYSRHPAVIMWHISNEFSGECYCDLCLDAFRTWLKAKYRGKIENLNDAYWAAFWSQSFTDWAQIFPPTHLSTHVVHGLFLDWQRFVNHQTIDYIKAEIAPLKEYAPDLPVTANFMGFFKQLDQYEICKVLDIASVDQYPWWGQHKELTDTAMHYAAALDLTRSGKQKGFMLMESTPSMTNWQAVSKLKRPGVHEMSSLQAIAHGSETVMYFQWRKGRGASEKFHGAVVDHDGSENHRVFKEVAQLGKRLIDIKEIVNTPVEAEVAIVFDWENWWAIDAAMGPRNSGKKYLETVMSKYKAFWKQGIPVDFIGCGDRELDLRKYKLIVAPMLYMMRNGFGEKLRDYTAQGGTLVATYWTGIVDENDLCYLGGFPYQPLAETLGIVSEEIDALYDGEKNRIGKYEVTELCDLIHVTTADVLETYADDFYAGKPALTVNAYGDGKAYYVAARTGDDFNSDFYGKIANELGIKKAVDAKLPDDVVANKRGDYVFIFNCAGTERTVTLSKTYINIETGKTTTGELKLNKYQAAVLKLNV
jgi:beta-galactosidase